MSIGSRTDNKSFMEQAGYRAALIELEAESIEKFLRRVEASPQSSEVIKEKVEGLRRKIELLRKYTIEYMLEINQINTEI